MSEPRRSPRVRARIITTGNGTLLLGVVATDDPRAQGGIVRLSPAAVHDLPAAIAAALEEFRPEQAA